MHLRARSLLRRSTASLFVGLGTLAVVASCGGSDADTSSSGNDAPVVATVIEPATPVVIPTSTPLPTTTPLPTATAEPLTPPTPVAVLLTTAFTNDSKVTTVGIDEVFFGMTPAEAAEKASTEWIGTPSRCYVVTPADGPDGVALWVVDGFIERVDVEHPDIRTPSSLGIGNTLPELQSQLGERLSSESNADGTVIATFTPSDEGDRDFRLVFELVDDAVVRYRSGRVGIVERASSDC